MKFDNIIIGGGLGGFISGIETVRAGMRTAIISTGQSALHFWGGSFGFLGSVNGEKVTDNLLEHAAMLPAEHPYRRLGIERTGKMLGRAPEFLAEAGINMEGSLKRNHFRLTPMGFLKPAWLSLEEYATLEHRDQWAGRKAAIVNVRSYIDFYPGFLANGLAQLGVESQCHEVDVPQLDVLRKSTTEMRATNMSRFLTNDSVDMLADAINKVSGKANMVIMPAILGIFSDEPVRRLRERVDKPVWFIATTPASVPGVRCQLALRNLFTSLGGVFLPGDTVVEGTVRNHRLESVRTTNFGDMPLYADNVVMSTGSFFGHGIVADMSHIYEPILGLDVNLTGGRSEWYSPNLYDPQPYMKAGVVTDDEFHPLLRGEVIDNVYVAGALLGGVNTLKEGSGAGITIATALHAAERITAK